MVAVLMVTLPSTSLPGFLFFPALSFLVICLEMRKKYLTQWPRARLPAGIFFYTTQPRLACVTGAGGFGVFVFLFSLSVFICRCYWQILRPDGLEQNTVCGKRQAGSWGFYTLARAQTGEDIGGV
jgi:hypothetical protein